MKLVIAIVNDDDAHNVQSELTKNNFFVTRMSTTGGFLRQGNTTFMSGVDDDKVGAVVNIIKENASKRMEKEPTIPPTEMGEFFNPMMIDVLVGGATVFVLDVDQFLKF